MTCRDLLLHITHLGQPRDDNVEVSVGDRRAGISYRRCDTACSVHGLAKIVVLNYAENVRRIRLPKKRACPSCDVLTVADSDSPWLMYTGVANKYHLLWGASVNDDFLDELGEDDACEDMDGYTCTSPGRTSDIDDWLSVVRMSLTALTHRQVEDTHCILAPSA